MKCDEPLSNFAFSFIVSRYKKGIAAAVLGAGAGAGASDGGGEGAGYVVLVFNNIAGGKRFNPLSVAVSQDGGATWPW